MWVLIVAVVVVLLLVAVGIRSNLRQRRRRRLLADSDSDYAGRDAVPGDRAADALDRASYEMRTRANNNFPNGYGGF